MVKYQEPNNIVYVLKRDGSSENPYVDLKETWRVANNVIWLNETPDKFTRLKVEDENGNYLYETKSELPKNNEYYCDYRNGIIKFNSSLEGKKVTIYYRGTGKLALSYKRLVFENYDEQQTIQTLGEIAQDAYSNARYAEEKGDFANTQGNYAQTQGNRAKDIADNTRYIEPYKSTVQYKKNNIVSFNGNSFIAKKDTKGNPPPADIEVATENEYWGLVGRKGNDGTGTVKTREDVFIAKEGQREFTLSYTYDQYMDRTWVYVGGVLQKFPENYDEIANNKILLSEGVPAGTEVIVKYFTESVPLQSDIQTKVDNHTTVLNNHTEKLIEHTDKIQNVSAQLAHEATKTEGRNYVSETIRKMQEGERVIIVAYGDSITFGYTPFTGVQVSKTYAGRLQEKLRELYNNQNIHVINRGTPGWQSDEGLANFDTKVLLENPDLVLIMFGINDCRGHGTYGPIVSIEDYKTNLSQMVLEAKINNIEVVLMSPTPIIDTNNDNHIRLLDYARAVNEVASSYNVGFVDLQTELTKFFFKKQEAPSTFLPDKVHLKEDKYPLIGDIILGKLLYHQNAQNVLRVSSKDDVHIPIVDSPYVETDITIKFENDGQFYRQNYILREDGGNGTYLKFSFFNETPGMSLILKSPKNALGGQINVLVNGVSKRIIDCYSVDSYVFEAEDTVIEDIPIGFHTIEFNYTNITKGQTTADVAQIYLTEFVFKPKDSIEAKPYSLLDTVTTPQVENFKSVIKGTTRLINPNTIGAVGSIFFSDDKVELKEGKTLVIEVEGLFKNRSGITWFGNHANSSDGVSNHSKLDSGYMVFIQNTGVFLYKFGKNNSTGNSIASNTEIKPTFDGKNKIRVEHTYDGEITVFVNDVEAITKTNTQGYTGWFGLYAFEQGTVEVDRYEYCYI